MECPDQKQKDFPPLYLYFIKKILKERVPISGDIEITRQCNFNCIHCYLGEKSNRLESFSDELTTQQWMNIIDDLTGAGCLYLLFTGGEPLLRKDFKELFIHAKKSGLILTVFTNGSLITEHIIETFKEYQPYCVEITLYGASENTYQSITGQTGMYEKCLSNIRALINAGIPTRLKTILLTKNYNEFEDMRQLAKDLDVQFRFDGMIFPCLNGDPSPIAYRISPEEVAEISLSCEKFVTDWEQTKERMKHVPASEFLYSCGAGVNNFHIDYSGLLKPCIMVNTLSHNLLTGSFQEGWYNVIPEIKKKKIPLEFACNNCENHIYCGYCPAFFRLETGSETKISEFLCRIGNRMNRLIREKNEAGAR